MIAPDHRTFVAPVRRIALKIRGTMFWVTALLASIIWVLGLESGFLGFGIHIFLLAALLSGLTALLPPTHDSGSAARPETEPAHASSVPASQGVGAPALDAATAAEREMG